MSSIFPRLDPHLILSNRIGAPTVVNAIEAIKHELVLKLTQSGVGNRIQGEVIAKLADGSYIAKIADLPVHVDLPRNPAIGQKISLTISQILPHPVFVLHESEQASSLISPKTGLSKIETPFHDYIRQLSAEKQQSLQAANTANLSRPPDSIQPRLNTATQTSSAIGVKATSAEEQQGLPVSSALPSAATTETELSPAARLISQVLKEHNDQQAVAQIRAPKALIELMQASELPSKLHTPLANELRQNIQQSGLFYESHLADWINGKRSLAELKSEPQAKLTALQSVDDKSPLQSVDRQEHEQLSQLVNQQLKLLDQQGFHYQGLLATGMPFLWTVNAREQSTPHTPQTSEETGRSWSSTLEIDLPELGKIAIAFTLNRNKLDLSLRGNKADTIEKLDTQFPQLASVLQSTGADIVTYKSSYHEFP